MTAYRERDGASRWFGGVVVGLLGRRETSIFIAAILLIVYFQSTASAFLSTSNIQVLAQFTAATAIMAIGEVSVVVCREVDLSVGSIYALAPFVMYFAHQAGVPMLAAVVLALLAAAGVGLVNGMITVLLRVPSFVTTLGTLFLLLGVTLSISGGFPVQPTSTSVFVKIFGGAGFSGIIWALVLAIVFQIALSKSRWGLHTIATGGNPTGAAEVGIRIGRIKIESFILCGMLGGFAGILDALRIGSIDPLAGGDVIMFMAIAAAVIGGTILTGGSGTMVGAFLGALVLGILKDGFTLSGVSAYTFDIILGAAILVTMVANIYLGNLRLLGSGRRE